MTDKKRVKSSLPSPHHTSKTTSLVSQGSSQSLTKMSGTEFFTSWPEGCGVRKWLILPCFIRDRNEWIYKFLSLKRGENSGHLLMFLKMSHTSQDPPAIRKSQEKRHHQQMWSVLMLPWRNRTERGFAEPHPRHFSKEGLYRQSHWSPLGNTSQRVHFQTCKDRYLLPLSFFRGFSPIS